MKCEGNISCHDIAGSYYNYIIVVADKCEVNYPADRDQIMLIHSQSEEVRQTPGFLRFPLPAFFLINFKGPKIIFYIFCSYTGLAQ